MSVPPRSVLPILRFLALAALLATALTACSPAAGYVVVRKVDGYYLAAGSCPLPVLASVRVANWNRDDFSTFGEAWEAAAVSTSGAGLPAAGLAMGQQNDGFEVTSNGAPSLAPGAVVEVRIERADGGLEEGYAYDLTIDVGQYRSGDGGVGSWSDLVADSACLKP